MLYREKMVRVVTTLGCICSKIVRLISITENLRKRQFINVRTTTVLITSIPLEYGGSFRVCVHVPSL